MRIHIDRETCIGAASCVAIAAKTFGLDQEGKVYILNESKATAVISDVGTAIESGDTAEMDPRDVIIEGARSCPVQAIALFEDDGTQIVL